jgi:metal-dependent HD superfamily phosphatase/phosphodiesterase
MEFNIPCKNNSKLAEIMERVKKSAKLATALRMSNVTTIDRLGFNDHGPTHVKIVANMALKMLRTFVEAGIVPSCVKNYGLAVDDAEVIAVLGTVLHDVGQAVHRKEHESLGVVVAVPIIEELLKGIYEGTDLEVMKWEIAHCVYCHEPNIEPLTIEAGIVKVADALDMEKGRARVPYQAGSISIHSVSAMAIDEVAILETGNPQRPLRLVITMGNPAGIFQIDNLLTDKIQTSGIAQYLQVEAMLMEGNKSVPFKKYEF